MNDTPSTTLYIVRHADAGQSGDPRYPDDALRPLSKPGRKRFRRLVKKLVKRGFAPTLIATSPLVRCRQTADVLAELVPGNPQPIELDELKPGAEFGALLTWTAAQQSHEIAWVGHAPDVNLLASQLIGAKPEAGRCGHRVHRIPRRRRGGVDLARHAKSARRLTAAVSAFALAMPAAAQFQALAAARGAGATRRAPAGRRA